MNIRKQKFLILGLSKSGYNATKLLLGVNNKCYIYEDHVSEKMTSVIKELTSLGAVLIFKEDALKIINEIDVLVISPGIKINHEIAVLAKQNNKRIISELELGYNYLMPEIIAVTGTNGKTTTVSLINEIYKQVNEKTFLIGNIGVPLTEKCASIDNSSVCVTEVSSFQLESTNSLCPHISCVLNISPDHLERHYSMENYIFLKKRIFKNQKESEYTVLNFDDEKVKEFYNQTNAKVVWVSKNQEVDGAYRVNGKLFYKKQFVMDENKLSLKGEHNVENALFAIACAKIDKIEDEIIINALSNFKGIEHRIELVDKVNGIKFYNDSKSTNTASTISAIRSVSPSIILLGGKEKGENYDKLFEEIKASKIEKIILYGSSRVNMFKSALKNNLSCVTLTENFYSAVKISAIFAGNGDTLLLSPACSSLDEFSCFEERGNEFKKFVESLK